MLRPLKKRPAWPPANEIIPELFERLQYRQELKMRTRDVLNADEVSMWLRIPKSSLYKLCSEGQIPCAKIGKHWRFDRALVDSWFERRIRARTEHNYMYRNVYNLLKIMGFSRSYFLPRTWNNGMMESRRSRLQRD